jgi:transcriptional repressor NrdR
MECPFCHIDNDRVVDTRNVDDGAAIRRRRKCASCGRRFTTYERIELSTIKVVKKDGSRVPYDRLKLKRGIEKACWKRPVSDRQVEGLLAEIESELEGKFDSEVPTRELGELVMDRLRSLDQVAYVRFASVYREFKDVQDFVEELRPMLSPQ